MYVYKNKGYRIFKVIIYIFLFIFLVFPIYWMLTTALRTDTELYTSGTLSIMPKTFTFEHFKNALLGGKNATVDLLNALKNSTIIVGVSTILILVVGFLQAYALNRFQFRGKGLLNGILLSTQIVPGALTMVPLYIMMSKMGLLNTYGSMWLMYVVGYPIAVILMGNYIRDDIPPSLEEAAAIDGCNRFQVMRYITFPLILPGVASTAIYVFITYWQEYLVAVSFISKREMYTVSMALTLFSGRYNTNWGDLMAAAFIISVPVIVLFLLFHDAFEKNLAGGEKG